MEELISEKEGQWLLELARDALNKALMKKPPPEKKVFYLSKALKEKHGLFVSLWLEKQLRGCVGTILPSLCLDEAIKTHAIKAALNDIRFSPVTEEELGRIKIEISILSQPTPIETSQIELGVHGLLICHGNSSGVLFPHIPLEYGWDKATFVQQLCMKAGLAPDALQAGADLFSFKMQSFKET